MEKTLTMRFSEYEELLKYKKAVEERTAIKVSAIFGNEYVYVTTEQDIIKELDRKLLESQKECSELVQEIVKLKANIKVNIKVEPKKKWWQL